MNPLAFVATAAGFYWTIFNLLEAAWPVSGPGGTERVADQLMSAVGPQVHYGLLGISMHLALRALGSRRSVLGSAGVSFFIGGSIGTVVALVVAGTAQYIAHVRGTSAVEVGSGDTAALVLVIAAAVTYGAVCVAMARAMMALHAAQAWKAAVAVAFSILATALLFGMVLPDGSYGWHPYLRIDLEGPGVAFGFSA